MKASKKKIIGLALALVMSISAIFTLSACESKVPEQTATTTAEAVTVTETATADEAELLWKDAKYTVDTALGEGKTSFDFKVTAGTKSVTLTINTDETILGTALMNLGLIDGDVSEYGLYVKYANGMFADYNTDKHYWALYKEGEMMMTGVDGETITPGACYEMLYAE